MGGLSNSKNRLIRELTLDNPIDSIGFSADQFDGAFENSDYSMNDYLPQNGMVMEISDSLNSELD